MIRSMCSCGAHAQLLAAMMLGSLCQEVEGSAPGPPDPVDRAATIAETEHLHPVDQSDLAGPVRHAQRSVELALGDPR